MLWVLLLSVAPVWATVGEPAPPAPGGESLAPGQVQTREIPLQAGQRLHLRVDQAHLDAEVRVLAPDGSTLGSVDNAIGRGDPLTLTVLSSAPGTHRIEIRLRAATSRPGTYRLTVDPPAPATDADRRRMEAEQLRAAAAKHGADAQTGSAAKAREEYRRSIEIWRGLNDPLELAITLSRHGELLEKQGELTEAKKTFEEALPIWRRTGDLAGESDCVAMLGGVTTEMGDFAGGTKLLQQALEMRRRAGPDPTAELGIVNDLAVTLSAQGDHGTAVERYTDALALARESGDGFLQAKLLENRATDLGFLGQLDRALADFDEAARRFHALDRPMDEALCEFGMGNALALAWRHKDALPHLEKALPVLQRAGNKHFAALTLNDLGLCYLALRQYPRARRNFQQAIQMVEATGNRRAVTAFEGNLGRVLLEEGHPGEALVLLERSHQAHRQMGDRAHDAIALMNIGRAERQLGRLEEAREHILEGIRMVEQSRSTVVGATARASYWATEHGRYEGLVNVLMDLHARSPSAGSSAQALGASETARARSLLELLADARADVRDQVPPSLREEERAFDRRLETQQQEQAKLLRRAHTPAEADAMERSLENLRIEGEEIQARMRAASPSYASLTRPAPLTLEEIRAQVLDPSTVLLEYFLGDERSYVWAVSSDRLVSAQLPRRSVVEAAVAKVYRAWSNPSAVDDGRAAAEALARMVLAPVGSGLSGRRIIVAADGALAEIPFGALPEPGTSRALLERHEIVAVPSASVLAVLRGATKARPPPAIEIAVLADPTLTPGDGTSARPPVEVASLSGDLARSLDDSGLRHLEPLPATRREAAAIAAHAPPGRVFMALGSEASRATALGEKVAHARVVHLASHALLDAKRPELSGVVLSMYDESGKPQDGFLSLADVYRMRLDAELVVLSACRTGLGKELRGEGLLGLTRGFMNAGAPRVVASMWKVSDQATAALMDRFYRALLEEKLAPAAALRQAQLELRKERRFSSPFAWAGFQMQGEWRPIPGD